MNYLAHAYLSFGHKELLVGNMISDFVKGKNKFLYPENIQKGIMLHRTIDTFTDNHEATKKAKEIFRPHYRLYSGAFVDVVYDHFLAADPNEFSEDRLANFSQDVYDSLSLSANYFPERFARMFPYMRSQNWLFNYRNIEGAELSFGGLVRRARYINESKTAAILFEKNYKALQACYQSFFPDVKLFASGVYKNMMGL
jgi:acyl carrier protein phosphodiesterase